MKQEEAQAGLRVSVRTGKNQIAGEIAEIYPPVKGRAKALINGDNGRQYCYPVALLRKEESSEQARTD